MRIIINSKSSLNYYFPIISNHNKELSSSVFLSLHDGKDYLLLIDSN